MRMKGSLRETERNGGWNVHNRAHSRDKCMNLDMRAQPKNPNHYIKAQLLMLTMAIKFQHDFLEGTFKTQQPTIAYEFSILHSLCHTVDHQPKSKSYNLP